MKIAVPLACAWYLHERPLPPSFVSLVVLALAIFIPTLLIAEQPDLGTSLLVATARRHGRADGGPARSLHPRRHRTADPSSRTSLGNSSCTTISGSASSRSSIRKTIRSAPATTSFSRRSRSAPAACSARVTLRGSQAQLEFLPERSTDFIFAVIGEEWGLIGVVTVLLLFMFVVGRALYLAATAQDTFCAASPPAVSRSRSACMCS